MFRTFEGSSFVSVGLVLATMAVSACGDARITPVRDDPLTSTELCFELQRDLVSVISRDAIPALTDPTMVPADDNKADYLLPTDRVMGIELEGDFIAIPHNILWWHEIVNLNVFNLAVTYCPFTGSSMVFDRGAAGGAELGTSGLLFKNNLVMYDRVPDGERDSLWPQMVAGGRCGPNEGQTLDMFASIEMEWEDWVALHPDTRVVSRDTGHARVYTANLYPYGDYEELDNARTQSPLESIDPRRPPKERVLGIPFDEGGGIAFPFGTLRSLGDLAVVHDTIGDSQRPIVVFWDGGANAAMAFRPLAGQDLTFEVRDGAIVDLETGSQWTVDGEGLSGPLVGRRLLMIPEAYVSFWFAFATFFEDVELWLP